ncbi:MAG: ABC transporter ATP-binding protein [Parachlamydiaceae bacterium]
MPRSDLHSYPPEGKVFFDRELIKKLVTYLLPYKGYIFFSFIVLIVAKVIEAMIPIYMGQVAQDLLKDSQLFLSFTGSFVSLFCLLFLAYLLESLNVFLRGKVGQRATLKLREEVYRHTQQLPMQFFDKNSVGKLMTRTLHDVDQIHQMLAESFVPLVGNLFLFICIVLGIFYVNWAVGIAVIVILPVMGALINYFRKEQRRCYDQLRLIVSSMNGFIQENLMGIQIIKNFNLEKQERKVFEKMNQDHRDAYLNSISNFSFFISGIEFLQNLTLILAFIILAYWMGTHTGFQAGAFFTFSLYALMIFRPLVDLAERYNVLQAAMAGASRVFSLLEEPVEVSSGEQALQDILSIEFEDVWFSYDQEHPILKGLSFHLKKGESVALVGITGAGKTTIINLLLRLYHIQKGRILINGQEIGSYDLKSLRSCFSMVLQDPILFSGTIAENIAFFEPISRRAIEASAGYVNLQSFIKQLPLGIDHYLGERGLGLSVGEMQLVSLARAVAHQRSVLILDEATANIDTVTEGVIQEALIKILKEKTALVIAHRLSTIRHVNRILVLSEGKVVESGTHEELIQAKGLYEKLYFLQF